jgi:hypothetical protein
VWLIILLRSTHRGSSLRRRKNKKKRKKKERKRKTRRTSYKVPMLLAARQAPLGRFFLKFLGLPFAAHLLKKMFFQKLGKNY